MQKVFSKCFPFHFMLIILSMYLSYAFVIYKVDSPTNFLYTPNTSQFSSVFINSLGSNFLHLTLQISTVFKTLFSLVLNPMHAVYLLYFVLFLEHWTMGGGTSRLYLFLGYVSVRNVTSSSLKGRVKWAGAGRQGPGVPRDTSDPTTRLAQSENP